MSRSYRKPYVGQSKKQDKKLMNKKGRSMVRSKLASIQDFEEIVLPRKNREVMNIWSFDQDGKQRYEPETSKLKRK